MSGPNVLSSSEAQIHFYMHQPGSLEGEDCFIFLSGPQKASMCYRQESAQSGIGFQTFSALFPMLISGYSRSITNQCLWHFRPLFIYNSWHIFQLKRPSGDGLFFHRISPFFHSSFLIAPDSICQRAGDTPTHTACNTVASQQNCKCTGGQHVAAGGKSHLTRRERRRIERETQRERRHSAICSLSTVSQMWFGT